MDDTTAAGYTSWLPDVNDVPLGELAGLDLGEAGRQILERVDRPSTQLAGSGGS